MCLLLWLAIPRFGMEKFIQAAAAEREEETQIFAYDITGGLSITFLLYANRVSIIIQKRGKSFVIFAQQISVISLSSLVVNVVVGVMRFVRWNFDEVVGSKGEGWEKKGGVLWIMWIFLCDIFYNFGLNLNFKINLSFN